jgi:microcystin-dependent protein
MAERISSSKGLTFTPPFDTYIPELSDNADIQNAFELFYYGNSSDGNTLGDVSIYGNLVDFDTRITTVTGGLSGHDGATSDIHGTGAGNSVVGTGTLQTLTNKTLTSPIVTGGTLNGGVALTVDSTELNTLDGITASTAELNTLDGITATVSELNTLDGITATVAELNTLDGITASTAELNTLDGITATVSELNTLDGITATVAELNTLDGITATVTELNYVDGVTSDIQTQLNTKAPSADPTFTGTVVLPSNTSIGTVTSTELSYVDGVTSSIQTQISTINTTLATNTPTGMISIHAGAVAPTGWLICNGASYASASYATLFSVIGYTFGGSGANFNVPNLKGRVVVGIDGSQTQFDSRGETGGAITHQHAASNSGNTSIAHNHTVPALNTNSVGAGDHNHNVHAHTHTTIDHFHGVNAHDHNTNTTGDHDHPFEGSVSTSNNGVSQSRTTGNTVSTNIPNHSHGDNFNPTTTGAHAHNTNSVGANTGGAADYTGQGTGNTTSNVGSSTSSQPGNHNHSVATISASTVDGAGGSHTHTTPASDAISNLQPYMALNYIIKI